MANGTPSDFQDCTLQPFEKNRYFYSKLLTVSDFEVEQRYGISKDRLIHRLLHGHGISYGIEVREIALNAQNKLAVKLTEGAALDCCGNEIIVPNPGNAIEVKEGDYSQDGTYYLYLKYAECQKDPMPQLANGSSCEESCCYSRIQETFTLAIAKAPTTTISGKVIEKGSNPKQGILNAKIISFSTDGNIQGITTTTNAAGDYQLPVFDNQAYDIKASASGYQSQTKRLSGPGPQEIELVKTTSDCQNTTENYEETYLKTKSKCTDPKVLIAVFTITAGQPKVDDSKTKTFRSVIYSNPMLHDLLCAHVGDLDNPHETTAEQVKALQSVNDVGNVSGQPYTRNIKLVSQDNKISISPQQALSQIDLSVQDGAIERRHLNSDVINNLITSEDKTITISHTNNADNEKKIDLKVNPGTNILSVQTVPAPGTAAKFAREDHVHNLADGVVTNSKIGNGEITGSKIQNGAVTRSTHLAEDITDLLTSTDNSVSITPNAAAKTIDLSVQTGASSFTVATGVVIFQDMLPSQFNTSPEIRPNLPSMDGVAIIMAVELEKMTYMGDLDGITPNVFPATIATCPLGSPSFRIRIRDRRQGGDNFTWRIRWWAIPSTVVMPDIEVPNPPDNRFVIPEELVLPRIVLKPGITLDGLVEELGVEAALLEPALEQLVAEGRIQRRRDRFFPPR